MINLKNIFPGLFSSKPSTQTTISNASSPGNIVPYTSTQQANSVYGTGSGIAALQKLQINSYQHHLNIHNQALGQMQYRPGSVNYGNMWPGQPSKYHKPAMAGNGTFNWEFHINLPEELENFKILFNNSEAFRNEVKSIASSKVFNDDLKSLIEESSDE